MIKKPKLTEQGLFHRTYEIQIQGFSVRFTENTATGQLYVSSDDLAKMVGYQSFEDMMKDPEVQKMLYSPEFQQVLKMLHLKVEDLYKRPQFEDFIPKN